VVDRAQYRARRRVKARLYSGTHTASIEVKNAGKVRDHDLDRLRTFLQDYPKATAVLLYRGTERLREQGIWCVPIEEFLRRLSPSTPVARAARVPESRHR
jgi:hypothetical protein